MPLPEIELHRVNKLFTIFCEQRDSPDIRDQIKLHFNIKGNRVILIESGPYNDEPSKWSELPVALFEYSDATKIWSLCGYNRNDKRLPYSKGHLEKLFQEVDNDSTGIFWG
jgi:hypothetical protein